MCDEVVGGDLLVQLVVGALVTPHQVVQLVPGLSLGPLLARMVLLDNFLAQGVGGQVLGIVLDAGKPVWNCISNLASAGPNLFTLQMKIIHCSFTVSWLFCVSFMFYNSTRFKEFKACKDPHKFHQPRFGRSPSSPSSQLSSGPINIIIILIIITRIYSDTFTVIL